MTDETYVTRREIDLLKADADLFRSQLDRRLSDLEEHGSRGVPALQVRMDNMVTTMSELKADVTARFDAHEREHERDEARRTSSRRWAVGAVIAAVAAIDGPLVTILLARR